jgi:hypothetical protein
MDRLYDAGQLGEAAEQQRLAIELFRTAVLAEGNRGDVWSNLALTTRTAAERMLRHSKDSGDKDRKNEALAWLRESLAAADVGAFLGNGKASGIGAESLRLVQHYFGSAVCLGTPTRKGCSRYQAEVKAMSLLEENRNQEAAEILCYSGKMVTVQLTGAEQRGGYLSGESMRRLWILMRVCGVVSIKDVFQVGTMDDIAVQQALDFEEFYQTNQGELGVEKVDSAGRSERRLEVKFPNTLPYTNPDLLANRFLVAFVKTLLTPAMQIDTFSSVTSLPGAPIQHYHNDVPHLFKTEAHFLAPQALVVVAPLVNLTKTTGPTEFMTGSHISTNGNSFWSSQDFQPSTPVLSIPASVGSVVIFDVRLRHRGGANLSEKRRPIVYMSYARDWYSDKVNYKEKQTSAFDELSPQQRKLMARYDPPSSSSSSPPTSYLAFGVVWLDLLICLFCSFTHLGCCVFFGGFGDAEYTL